MMFNWPLCTVCKQESDDFVSYSKTFEKGGTVTKLCCKKCDEKTHEKWIENGYIQGK